MELQNNKGQRYYERARILMKQGRFSKAQKYFQTALSLNYNTSFCFLNLGVIQLYEMETSEAFKTFQMVLTNSQNPGDVYYYMGKVFQNFDNNQESISNFKKAIVHSKNEIVRLLSYEAVKNDLSFEERDEYKEKAFNSYLIRTDIHEDEEIIKKGIIARIEKRFEESVAAFEEVIGLYPDYFMGYYELAKTYMVQRRYHLAYEIMKKIKGLFKLEGLILREISKLTYLLRRHKETCVYVKKLIRHNPENPKLFFNLATALALLNKSNEAIKYFKKALDLNPNFFQAAYNIAVIYQQNGFLEEALEYYQKGVLLKPDYSELNYNLGLIYFETQEYFQSLYYFMKAYNLDNTQKEALANFDVIRNLKSIENNVVRPLELSIPSKVSLAFSVVMLLLSFFYLIKWI